MPVAPTDSAEDVLNTARVRLNDAIVGLGGDVLQDTAPFTLIALNAAWRRLQELLVNFGVAWLKPETVFASVVATTNADPASQQYIGWAKFFDGTNLVSAPVLPQDLIAPLAMWERTHAVSPTSFFPMDKLDNGLPAVPKTTLNHSWEWRNGAIYLPGCSTITDIRLRYAGFFADFVSPNTTAFASQPVPIVRSLNAFAWFVCSEVAKGRGDVDAGDFDQKAQIATRYIFELEPSQAKAIQKESEYQRMTDQDTPTMGPAGPRGPQKGG